MSPDLLITHSGSFHADDVLAYVVLSHLHPTARLLRTRDAEVLAGAEGRAIVFDVGARYTPERHLYDHHQADRALRKDGLPYSSFGLIWQHFGAAYLTQILGRDAPEHTVEAVHAELDQGLVRDIDAVDNGRLPPGHALLHPLSLPSLLWQMRPAFNDERPEAMDEAFRAAAGLAGQVLRSLVETAAASLRSRATVEAAIAARPHPNWLELPGRMDYLGPILASGDERIAFVVLPAPGEWQLNAINVAPDSFELRRELPAEWAGLRGEALVAVTGVPDAVFCHAGRFIAIARSREGALALLDQALAAAPAAPFLPESPGGPA